MFTMLQIWECAKNLRVDQNLRVLLCLTSASKATIESKLSITCDGMPQMHISHMRSGFVGRCVTTGSTQGFFSFDNPDTTYVTLDALRFFSLREKTSWTHRRRRTSHGMHIRTKIFLTFYKIQFFEQSFSFSHQCWDVALFFSASYYPLYCQLYWNDRSFTASAVVRHCIVLSVWLCQNCCYYKC